MLTASCINRAYNNINGGHIMMTYATSSPAATTGGGQGNNNIPVSVQRCSAFSLHRPAFSALVPSFSYRQSLKFPDRSIPYRFTLDHGNIR